MEIRVVGSTKSGYQLPVEEAKLFAGHAAGICYMKDNFDTILNENKEKTQRRFLMTAGSGHHSVAGHASYNLLLTGVPKIIAMILNNEKDYNTSEKSARYTVMATEGLEFELYQKWREIFESKIEAVYPTISPERIVKLAQENARYFISVFTPATTMEYTVDFRQGNYLIGFLEDFARSPLAETHSFFWTLSNYLSETAKLLRETFNCDEIRDRKGRSLSLFATRERGEQFSETYSVNYTGTFAELAQAQRHRSINYEMIVPEWKDAQFYVPPIIRGMHWAEEYLRDMDKVRQFYPQGTLIKINERGTPEDFVTSKCSERLCGAAQLEICTQTQQTLDRYISEAAANDETEVFKYLQPIQGKTKCQFTKQICSQPCPLGAQNAFTRRI